MSTTTKKRPREKRARRSAGEARTFDHVSEASFGQICEAIQERAGEGVYPDCDCQPYRDVFTFGRWLDQGMAVRKGERALKISSFVKRDPKPGQDPTEERLIPKTLCLFCRCQVSEKEAPQ